MKGLFLFSIVLSVFASATAQTFPHWPQSTNIKVFMIHDAFTETEQIRIDAAVQSWRPFLPEGVTIHIAGETSSIEMCRDCVTLNRERTKKDEWGECEAHHFDGITWYAIIRVDKRAGSGDAFERVVAHEIGHSLGLDHRRKSIMSARAHGAPSEQDGAILRDIYASPSSALATGNGVDPLSLDGERVFKTVIRLGNRGRIMRLVGMTPPDKNVRVPLFTAAQKEVAGNLFPAEILGEGVLQSPLAIRVRRRVSLSDCELFGSHVSIAETAYQ